VERGTQEISKPVRILKTGSRLRARLRHMPENPRHPLIPYDTTKVFAGVPRARSHTCRYADTARGQRRLRICTGVIYGRELSMTRKELAKWRTENAVHPGQTVTTKMEAKWPPAERLQVGDRLFISAHVWNSSTWHIYQRGILPATLRNREPLLLAVVEKITAKRIDISIPHLHLHRGTSIIMYRKPMTIQDMKLWTCREHNLHESTQVALGVQELEACTLREELQRAAGMIR